MTQASLVTRAPSADRVCARAAGALARAGAHRVPGARLGAAPLLRPRELTDVLHHPAGLERILRCPGTNDEQFTALLGTRIEADLAPDQRARNDGGGQHVTVLGCDTVRLGELLPAASRQRVDRSIDRDVLRAVPTSHPRVEQLAALAADQEDHTP